MSGDCELTKSSKTYFLTAYLEYLLECGIRSEEYYLGDASRFIRFLIQNAGRKDLEAFIRKSCSSPGYERRIRKTLRKFCEFARHKLELCPGFGDAGDSCTDESTRQGKPRREAKSPY